MCRESSFVPTLYAEGVRGTAHYWRATKRNVFFARPGSECYNKIVPSRGRTDYVCKLHDHTMCVFHTIASTTVRRTTNIAVPRNKGCMRDNNTNGVSQARRDECRKALRRIHARYLSMCRLKDVHVYVKTWGQHAKINILGIEYNTCTKTTHGD